MDVCEVKRRIAPVLSRHEPVGYALVFGSTARRVTHPASDVDLVVGPAECDILTIAAELTAALGIQADVVRGETAPLPLLEAIVRDGAIVYEREPGAGALFLSRALATLETDGPWYRRMRDAFLRRVAARGLAPAGPR